MSLSRMQAAIAAAPPSKWHQRSMAAAMRHRFGESCMPYEFERGTDPFTWKCTDIENGVGHFIWAEFHTGRLKVTKEQRGNG